MQKVCVLGLGYIGLPTASMLATHGFQVVGVDVNPAVVETVSRGGVHIVEPGLQTLVKAAVRSGNLRAAGSPEEADVFIIAVPTPVTDRKRADLSCVRAAAESIRDLLRPGNLVVVESTSPAGTCRDVLAPILEETGLKAGTDFYLAYCPERVLPGRTVKELIQNDRVIGGLNRASAEAAANIYRIFVEGAIHLTDCTTAEMVKLMENTYRDVNIALANELALVCERLGIDVWEAIRLANLHPRVNLHLPGPGVGGHCLAVDPWFIVEKCPEEARLIALGRKTNDGMPEYVVARVKQILSGDDLLGSVRVPSLTQLGSAVGTDQTAVPRVASSAGKPGFGENQRSAGFENPDWKVAVLGVAYKGNIDDARETPALRVLELFAREGISFGVYDPHVRDFPYELAPLRDVLAGADCLLILADHDEFRFLHPSEVGKLMRRRVAFDTKNVLDRQLWRQSGFELYCLGSGV